MDKQIRKTYPSDVSRKQFEQIRPFLESARRQTKPRSVDLYDVFCGVLYVLKGGIQWRMLPEGFPKWRTVYNYWQLWSEEMDSEPSILEVVLKKISWRGPTEPWQTKISQSRHH
jgi:transposase